MPFTEEFIKIRNRFANQYSDKAKAETFAFEKAFKLNIPTFTEERKAKFRRLKGYDDFI